jgi:hypothetical protein
MRDSPYQKRAAKSRVKSDTRTPLLFNPEPRPAYEDVICGIPVPTDVDKVISVPNNTDVVVAIMVVP